MTVQEKKTVVLTTVKAHTQKGAISNLRKIAKEKGRNSPEYKAALDANVKAFGTSLKGMWT